MALEIEDLEGTVAKRHRFFEATFRGEQWDLRHLEPFQFRAEVGTVKAPLLVDVIVFFSCHCFTKKEEPGAKAAVSEYYDDQHEVRVLCAERYQLSKLFLPRLIKELFSRHIRVASDEPNYVTFELLDAHGRSGHYAVFFVVSKDTRRRKRLLLRVQSAYRMDALTNRLKKAGKVNFDVLLRASYEGRKIRR